VKKINFGRVILGGFLAGVVYNASALFLHQVVLKVPNDSQLKALGKVMPQSSSTYVVWTILGFALGIASVWLYAAIRPRYGAGPGSAARAGVAVWFFSELFMAVVTSNLGVFTIQPLGLIWSLVASIVATILGASLYKEEGA
jgi:uncharacterized membrane protein YbhN (UPF0104 family)